MNVMNSLKSTKVILPSLAALLLVAAGFWLAGFNDANPPAQTDRDSSAADTASAKGGLAVHDKDGDGVVFQDPMHPWIVQDEPGKAPDCGMDLVSVNVNEAAQGGEEGTVKIDPVTMQNMGVRTAPVAVEPLGRTVRTTGRFEMNERGRHVVSLKVSGWVETLHADYDGAMVRKGQPLLELYSPQLVSTQEEYLLALRNVRRLEDGPAARDARRLLEATRRRLAYWDLTETQIERLEKTGEPQRTITFYAPASGEVMHKNVVEGQRVAAGQTLMTITDISTIWLIADVYEQDLSWIEVGTPARIELTSAPGTTYTGKVDYIYHMLEEGTRTAKARIVLPGGHRTPLKPGGYATVHLEGRKAEPAPVVPTEAVVRTGEKELVIVARGDGRFRPQQVRAGLESEGRVQILEGLQGDEEVVTSAQFLIDSEARLQGAVAAMTGSEDVEPLASASEEPAEDLPAQAQMQGNVQTVRITIGASGFAPERVEVKAGVPTRLIYRRTTDGTCAKQVQIPAFDVPKTDLPLGQDVTIEVTPDETGTFTFACGMGMLKGTLLVSS